MVAPWGAVDVGPGLAAWLMGTISPAALLWGWRRRSRVALLACVPLGWALPAYVRPPTLFSVPASAVALLAALTYVVLALSWLRGSALRRQMEWQALEGRRRVPPDTTPLVAGIVVAGPAVGAALWSTLGYSAAVGFPGHAGRVVVGLGLLGTLVGLAIGTDLARGRGPLRGSRGRAIVLATLSAGLLMGWAMLGGA